jgi:hypothetical protein
MKLYLENTIWQRFKRLFFYSWYYKVNNFLVSIKRLYTWLPVLWEDRDWDYGFILDILEFKIKQSRLYIEKYGSHLHKDIDTKSMRIAEILIDRIKNDKYSKLVLEEHAKKWGEYDFDGRYVTRTKVITKYDAELELAETQKIYEHKEYLRKQDWDYLCKHLKDNMAKWWD